MFCTWYYDGYSKEVSTTAGIYNAHINSHLPYGLVTWRSPAEGGETTKFHVTDIKKILPADQATSQLPDYNNLGRLTKIRLNPRDIPDLDWQLAPELNTVPSLHHTVKIDNYTTSIGQSTPRVSVEIILEQIRNKMTKIKTD